MLAVINISLGMINLLPFLPLDGGHAGGGDLRGHPLPQGQAATGSTP